MNNTAALGQFADWEVYFTIAIIGIISIIAVIGNILVFIAFYKEKRLRRPTNYLILSLAIADVFIGAFSVIIYAFYINFYDWNYSMDLCILWLSLDYWIFQASVFGVIIITIERFLVIKYPLINHTGSKKTFRIKLAIILTWMISFSIWVPAALTHYEKIDTYLKNERHCMMPFAEDKVFVLTTGLISYLLPVILMCFITGYTVRILRKSKQDNHPTSSCRAKQLYAKYQDLFY